MDCSLAGWPEIEGCYALSQCTRVLGTHVVYSALICAPAGINPSEYGAYALHGNMKRTAAVMPASQAHIAFTTCCRVHKAPRDWTETRRPRCGRASPSRSRSSSRSPAVGPKIGTQRTTEPDASTHRCASCSMRWAGLPQDRPQRRDSDRCLHESRLTHAIPLPGPSPAGRANASHPVGGVQHPETACSQGSTGWMHATLSRGYAHSSRA